MRTHQYRKMKSVVAATLLAACGSAFAANWDNGGVGDSWMNPTNWAGDILPAAGVVTHLDGSDTAVLYAGDTGDTGQFYFRGSGGGTADLTVRGTLTSDGLCKLSDTASSSSIVTIDGGTWEVQNYLYVGGAGTASLIVTNGGVINQHSSGYGVRALAGGTIDLVDGTIYTDRLWGNAGGLIRMTPGNTIISAGNDTTEINGLLSSGILVSTDPLAKITVSYGDGVTTVKAVVPDTAYLTPYADDENTYALWHMDSVSNETYILDDDSVVVDRNADLTLFPNPNTNGPTLVDPAATPGLDYPGGNAAFGNCIYLDNVQSTVTNTAQYMNIPWGDTPMGRNQFRLEGWCKSDVAFDDQILIDRWNQLVVYARDDGFQVLRWDGNNAVSYPGAFPAGFVATNWNHFALEVTYTNLKIYVNGFLESETELAGGGLSANTRTATTIGARYNTDSAFKGYIDEFRFSLLETPESPQALDFGAEYVVGTNVVYGSSTLSGPVTGDYDFDGSTNDTASFVPFGAVWAGTTSANWVTPEGKNGPDLRYGKLIANLGITNNPADLFGYDRIINWTIPHTVQLSAKQNTNATANMSLASAFYYEKSDFLNNYHAAGDIGFDFSSLIEVDFQVERQSGTGRALVRNGTDWYISADSIGNGTLSVLPYLADFYAFDPADNLLFDADNPGAAVSGSTLTNVTAIGLHMQHSNYDPTSGWVPYQFFKGLRATVSGVVPDMTSYAMWAEFHGLTGSDTNLTADLEPDGLDNLSEWALGGDPNLSDAASVLQSAVDGGVFVLNYKRRLNADDLGLDYTVGRDTDLVSTPEGWTTSGITETSGAIDEEFESVTNTVPTDVDGRFMRLKIDLD